MIFSKEQKDMEELETVQLSRCVNTNNQQIYLIVIVFFAILLIIYIGGQKTGINYSYIKLNNTFYPTRLSSRNKFDVVLSYYAEDFSYVGRFIHYLRNVSTLQKLQVRFIVYNKNSKTNNSYLREILKVDIVHPLPNVGREGGTYLYHIITNYHALANHTIFCQAGVEGITNTSLTDWLSNRLEKQFNSSVGYMPLVDNKWITTFDCGEKPGDYFPRLAELWGILEQTICPPNGQGVAYRGQFLVSSKRILNRPLRVYQYLYDLITADHRHWLHQDRRSPRFQSTPDNPIFGHVVERLWTTLFNCANPDLLDRCRRNQCACFD